MNANGRKEENLPSAFDLREDEIETNRRTLAHAIPTCRACPGDPDKSGTSRDHARHEKQRTEEECLTRLDGEGRSFREGGEIELVPSLTLCPAIGG